MFSKKITYLFFISLFLRLSSSAFAVSISGKIVDKTKDGGSGEAVTGFSVVLTGDATSVYVMDAGTLPAGNYEFNNLQPGKYTVTPKKSGYIFTPGNYSVNMTTVSVVKNFEGGRYVFIRQWGSSGAGSGQFNKPAGIAVNSSTNVLIYVADRDNHRIQLFSSTGSYLNKWGAVYNSAPATSTLYGVPPHDQSGYSFPYSVAIDSSGSMYVADTANHSIQKRTLEDDTTTWGLYSDPWVWQPDYLPHTETGTFNSPYGIAAAMTGENIFIVDTKNHRIQIFSSTGAFIYAIGKLADVEYSSTPVSGSLPGEFNEPYAAAVDKESNIYAADTLNNRIQRFAGDYWGGWSSSPDTTGSSGSGDGSFSTPTGISLDASGKIYVVDRGNNRVQVFTYASDATPKLNFLTRWGYSGTSAGQLDGPFGIAVDALNYIYVTDTNNNRIQKFASSCCFVNINGYVTDNSSNPLKDVSVKIESGISSSTFVTGEDGYYEFVNLPVNCDYTVTPSSSEYDFNPVYYSTPSLLNHLAGVCFIGVYKGSLKKYYIQGRITKKNSSPEEPIENVLLTLSGTVSSTTFTNSNGDYAFGNAYSAFLPAGGSYTITPSKEGYCFEPVSESTSSLSSNIPDYATGQDKWNFKGFDVYYISGRITDWLTQNAVPDVSVTLYRSGDYKVMSSTQTNSTGHYNINNIETGNYYIEPKKIDYTFNPASISYSPLDWSRSDQDFTAVYTNPNIDKLKIYGYVRSETGAGVNSVDMSMQCGTETWKTITDNSGYYEFGYIYGRRSYDITPSKINWIFVPVSTSAYLSESNKQVDFSSTYALSGVPEEINLPLGVNGSNAKVHVPAAGSAKIIVEERPEKKAKHRGTVNPSKNESVGILFTPNMSGSGYVGRKYTIKIFTLKGELVEEFVKTPATADDIWMKWKPDNLASGIYIVYIEGPGVKSSKKMAVLK
ncbi:MAG: Serine/threonine-protein kinase PknD [Elusimicrobia bacterium ADurb.Bin231]|nr:MAG: Serine/threonine-protein kinase PknD [Elusimicrobia bacterium ADurb.Bin231]